MATLTCITLSPEPPVESVVEQLDIDATALHRFPEAALQQLWSSAAETPAASEGWMGFLHEMAVYQQTWTPVTTHQQQQQQSSRQSRKRQRPEATHQHPREPVGEEEDAMQQDGEEEAMAPTTILPDAAVLEEARRQLDQLDASPPLPPAAVDGLCQSALQPLLRHAASAAAWQALSIERRSDAVASSLCRTMANDEALAARDVQAFLAGGLLPRLRAMQGPASRLMAEGLEALGRRRPRLLVDHVLLPLLLVEGVAWAHQELCVRLVKKGALPPVREQLVVVVVVI